MDKKALIVEGGGMRGVFAAGVLDAFILADFNPFDLFIGVSAGTPNLSSYLAKQHQRSLRTYVNHMTQPAFFSWSRFLQGGNYMDIGWLWEITLQENPIAVEAAFTNLAGREFLMVCTDVHTGQPVYLAPTVELWPQYLLAACSIPVLYKQFTQIGAATLCDGGVADPIPVLEAYRRGARKIVVIRSRETGYVKKAGFESRIAGLIFRRYPHFRQAFTAYAKAYQQAVDFMHSPPADTQVIQLAPNRPLQAGRTTRSVRKLMLDYESGLKQGEEFVQNFGQQSGRVGY